MNNDNQDKSNRRRFLRPLPILICAALVLLIVLVARNFDAIKRALNFPDESRGTRTEVFYYNANQSNVFATMNDGLLLASSSGVQYFNPDGEKSLSSAALMSAPALDTRNGLAAAYDIGGSRLRILNGESVLLEEDLDEHIIDVFVGSGGYFAVSSQETGYKGSVTVYDDALEPAFKWFSGSGYVLCSAISPDNQKLAVASIDDMGGQVRLLEVNSEEEGPVFYTSGSLILDLFYLSDRVLAAVGENAVYFLGLDGSLLSQYDYGGALLQHFSTDGEGFLTLHLTADRSGLSGQLVCLNENGTVTAEMPLSEEIISLSVSGKYIGVLYPNKLVIYDSSLSTYASTGGVSGASQILMRSDGTAIMISSYSASLYIP